MGLLDERIWGSKPITEPILLESKNNCLIWWNKKGFFPRNFGWLGELKLLKTNFQLKLKRKTVCAVQDFKGWPPCLIIQSCMSGLRCTSRSGWVLVGLHDPVSLGRLARLVSFSGFSELSSVSESSMLSVIGAEVWSLTRKVNCAKTRDDIRIQFYMFGSYNAF